MPQKRLLIVEHEIGIAQQIATIAAEAGYNPRMLTNPLGIAECLDLFEPATVILDLGMPEKHEFNIISYLHEMAADSKIIILSDTPHVEQTKNLALLHGLHVIAVVSKPFQKNELRALLHEARENPVKVRPLSAMIQNSLPTAL